METTQDNNHGGIGGGIVVASGGNGGWNDVTYGSIESETNQGGDIGGYGDASSDTIGGGTDDCGIGGVSMASEPSYSMAITTRKRIHDNRCVPPFLIKLYKMVDDEATNSIISWGSSGTTFIISDDRRFILEILPCYFKTSRFDNFISQLNNYGFKKKEWKRLEYEHEHFQEGKKHLLENIKRRNTRLKFINDKSTVPIATSELNATFTKVEHEQHHIKNNIQRFKGDIEKTFLDIQDIINTTTHKLAFSFSEEVDQKRKFLNVDLSIDFVDVVKDFELTCDKFEVLVSDVDGFVVWSESMEKVAHPHGSGSSGVDSGQCVPKFLHKLYDMVEKNETDSLISWNHPYRDSFVIWDINKFATHVLPMYFRHANFSSFNSQLNIYGFRKISWERHEYANEWFVRGSTNLLSNIKRREKNVRLTRSTTMMHSSMEVQTFKNQLKMIQQEQENKIIWLPKYEEQIKCLMNEFKEIVVSIANNVDKMILKNNQNFDSNKTTKLGSEDEVIDDDVIGNIKTQDSKVEDYNASINNNNIEAPDFFDDLGIDLEVIGEIVEMEDTLIIEREMEQYLALCQGKSSELNENFGFDRVPS